MKIKKMLLISILFAFGLIDIALYWSHYYTNVSKNLNEAEKRIKVLEKSSLIYPFNDQTYLEIGKAYFELAMEGLERKGECEKNLRVSVENLNRSVRLNPASQFAHFQLARALYHMHLLSMPTTQDYFNEYEKAARLVTFNSQIYFEVGRLFLSKWSELSEDNRKLTLDMLKAILKLNDREKMLSVFQGWELNVNKYDIMRQILPYDSRVYSFYAEFLGERSHSFKERLSILNEYDKMKFDEAKAAFASGENKYYELRTGEAADDYKRCINMLDRIRFYQNLSQNIQIDRAEFFALKKSTLLNLSKCLIETGKEWTEYGIYLKEYLRHDHSVGHMKEIEKYLKDWGAINTEFGGSIDDLDQTYFIFLLFSKQNRYREITKLGRIYQLQYGAIPREEKKLHVNILQILGDTDKKLGNLYLALDSFNKALEIDPDDIDTLLKKRSVLEGLGEEKRAQDISHDIDEIIEKNEILDRNFRMRKGRNIPHVFKFDGREILLDFLFSFGDNEAIPLVSIIFRGEVVWEGFLSENQLSIRVKTAIGENTVKVTAVNRDVDMLKLGWKDIEPQ